MKVVLKTIAGKRHEVEVEPTSTVLDVKKLMEEEYEPTSLRLCFNGEVLEDAKTLVEAGLKDGDSVVLAGRKRKIPKPSAPPAAEPATAPEAPAPAPEPALASSAPVEPQPTQPAPAQAPAPAEPVGTLAEAVAPANEEAAPPSAMQVPPPVVVSPAANPYGVPSNLMDEVAAMGFEDREQIALALRAAYMNVERAVEYLFDGIPPRLIEELTRNNAPAAAPAAGASAGASTTTASTAVAPAAAPAPAAPSAEAELRAALATIPQFDEIRALYVQNTDTMEVVMQQIALRHPAVYEQIERNPEAFLTIMSETGQPASAGVEASASGAVAPSTAEGTAPEGVESIMNQLPAELEITAADRMAVQQLVELGGGMWDEQSALLVYLATQRNQEMAASILFEHGGVPPELLAEIANQMAEEEGQYEDEQ